MAGEGRCCVWERQSERWGAGNHCGCLGGCVCGSCGCGAWGVSVGGNSGGGRSHVCRRSDRSCCWWCVAPTASRARRIQVPYWRYSTSVSGIIRRRGTNLRSYGAPAGADCAAVYVPDSRANRDAVDLWTRGLQRGRGLPSWSKHACAFSCRRFWGCICSVRASSVSWFGVFVRRRIGRWWRHVGCTSGPKRWWSCFGGPGACSPFACGSPSRVPACSRHFAPGQVRGGAPPMAQALLRVGCVLGG